MMGSFNMNALRCLCRLHLFVSQRINVAQSKHLTTSRVSLLPNDKFDYSLQKRSKIMQKMLRVKSVSQKTVSVKPQKNITGNHVPEMVSILGNLPAERENQQRRRNSLNKLYMEHVTDIMAMDSLSEPLVGLGIQITRVKISENFHNLNVYWFITDYKESEMIRRKLFSVGKEIRSKLTSLNILGKVPYINFVEDKEHTKLIKLEEALSKADFGPDDEDELDYDSRENEEADENSPYILIDHKVPKEKSKFEMEIKNPAQTRQDVLGLNHFVLWEKLMDKKKKRIATNQKLQNWPYFEPQPESRLKKNSLSDDLVITEEEGPNRRAAMDVFIKMRKRRKISKSNLKELDLKEIQKEEMEERQKAAEELAFLEYENAIGNFLEEEEEEKENSHESINK